MAHRVLNHGKYRDHMFGDIEQEDREYCAWVLRTRDLPSSLLSFSRYLRRQHGGILTVGKNRLKWFDEVLLVDPC